MFGSNDFGISLTLILTSGLISLTSLKDESRIWFPTLMCSDNGTGRNSVWYKSASNQDANRLRFGSVADIPMIWTWKPSDL